VTSVALVPPPVHGETSAVVGFAVIVVVLGLVVVVAYHAVIKAERARQRRERDAVNRNPANCSCFANQRCDAELDLQDYLDDVASRPLCLPCLYRPTGSPCYAAFVLEWGAR
jgi:hypothetical protein